MTDVFAKAVADLKLGDFAGDVAEPPKLQQPSSLDLLREQGVAGINGSRRSIDVVGDLIRMEQDKKKLAKLQEATTPTAIPSWADAVSRIAGFEALPYEQKKKLHDEYVQRAVAELQKVDPKTDALLLEQKVLEQAPAPIDPTGGKGDVSRAWSAGIANTKAAATGALGFVLDKFGADAQAKEMYEAMATYTKEAQDLGKANDTLTEALKPGGSLVDWAQYNVGQILPSLVESVITGAVGAAAGSAAGGVGAIPMAVAGAFGRTALKKKFAQSAAEFMKEQARKNIASGMTRQAALTAAREATELELKRAAGKTLGGMAGIFGAAYARGVGEIAQNAQEAGIDPGGLKGLEVMSGAGLYAAMEGLSDKLLLGALKGTAGGAVKRTLKRGAGTALAEGATEVGQDTVTGLTAGVGAPDGLAMFNAFAAGAVGGGVVGGAGGLLRPADGNTPSPTPPPAAEAELTDEELAALPPDPVQGLEGITIEIDGATLVQLSNGTWQYAEGAVPNPAADLVVSMPPPVVEEQLPPSAAAEPLPETLPDFEPAVEEQAPPAAAPVTIPELPETNTVELTPDGDVAVAAAATPAVKVDPGFGDPVEAFNDALSTATGTGVLTPQESQALDQFRTAATPLVLQLGEGLSIESADPTARGKLAALVGKLWGELNQINGNAAKVINDIVNQLPSGAISPSEDTVLPYVFKQLGMFNSAGTSQSPWAVETRKPGASVQSVLQATANDSSVGPTRSKAAGAILSLYAAMGKAFPKLIYNPKEAKNWWNPAGTIQIGNQANASTLVHEALHDLTIPGWKLIVQRAEQGSVEAQQVVALVEELHAALIKSAAGTKFYALADNYKGNAPKNRAEMFADLLEPGFLALAAQTPVGNTQWSEAAKEGLSVVDSNNSATLLDILQKVIRYILQSLSPAKPAGYDYDSSVASVLAELTAYAATVTANPNAAPSNAPAPQAEVVTGTPPAPANGPPNMATLEQVGPQAGTNQGGLYLDASTGIKWYIKTPKTADHARNEVLASRLYQAAGVRVPETHLVSMGGEAAVASRFVEGLKKSDAATLAAAPSTFDAFAVDAWLANWDVVGLEMDNLLLNPDGNTLRIDTGGALRYRAQGGLKGDAFGDTVTELDTLRDPAKNPQAASVFKAITNGEIKASISKVLKVSKETVEALVSQFGPADPAERAKLVKTLLARKANMALWEPAKAAPQSSVPKAPIGAAATAQVDWSSFIAPPETKLKSLKPKYWGHTLVWPDVVTKAIYMVGKPGKDLKPTHYPIIAWLDAVGVPPSQVNALYKQILVDIKAQVKKSKSKTSTINITALNKAVNDNATLAITPSTALDAELQKEFDDTAAKYGGHGTWVKAKAAGKTVLDYRAWVQVRTPRFLSWFGNWMDGSTENKLTLHKTTGEPREFYRGVPGTYSAFNKGKGHSFFTDSKAKAETYKQGINGGKIYPVFLRAPNPYIVEGKGAPYHQIPLDEATEPSPGKFGVTDDVVKYAFSKGYKTVMFHNIRDNLTNNNSKVVPADVIVISAVVDVKSSTDNSGEFSTDPGVTDIFNEPGDAMFSESGEAPIPVDNDVRPQKRTSTGALIDDMKNGTPASASTPTRGLLQAAKAKDKAGIAKALSAFGERLNEELHDASIRMKRWLQTLPEGDGWPALLKQRVIGSMYTARKKRDDVLRRMYDEHLAEIDRMVTAFGAKHKISTETATRDIGYAATAKTIPARNAFLLRKRIKALQAMKVQLDAAEAEAASATASTAGMVPAAQAAAASAPGADPALDQLKTAYAKAQVQLTELIAAINNQNIHVKKHGGGGVAGMNNAQAKSMLDGLRQQYGDAGFAEIDAITKRIYDMNAAKLALDIESGKVSPAVAAEFLERPAALPVLQELRELANTVDASNAASVKALEAKRKEAIAAVRTEYVPLSGDPTKDIDDSSFHGGSGIPNVQRDYELTGRERGAPPDDGLSASRAALMKSASYYGWRDFQDGIAAIHRALTPEQRQAVGIRAETLPPGRSTLSSKAVIRHRNGKTTAYIFDDETLVDAIRGASRLENNFLLEGAGKVTKLYSYLATQANPFFAPFNFIRDSWERSEFLRTRTYLRADGSQANSKSIAHGMLKYLADPELMRATSRYAFGKPLNADSRAGRYLDEFLRQGGVSVFSSQFGADRAKIIAQINKQKSWRQQLGILSRWIDGYNKTFDVGPALASYMAMRDAGMNTKDAAAGALDLMDFGKRGKSASVFGSIYAFAQPTFTGAANAITALRDPLTGKMNPVGMARMAGYVAGFLMLQAFLRSLADDDEGGNKLDQQSGFVKNNFLLIPYGDDGMIKVPLAYGLTRVANGIARAALGVGTNEQTPTEAVGKLVSGSVVPVFSPIEDSDIDWFERPAQALLTLFAPSWLKPPLALATNTTPFDSQIINSKYADPTKFKSEQFGKYSPESYKAMAKGLRELTGIDMAPEEIRYLFKSYPLGVAQLAVTGPLEDKSVGEAAHRKVYAEYSEFARYFQFKKAIDETDDLLKRTKAGESITDPMERQKLMWRLQWDEQDKELRSAKGKATRAAGKAGLRTDAIDGQFADVRMAAQVRALYRYRLMQGKDAVVGEPPVLD